MIILYLVCHVEEDEEFLLLANRAQLLPLLGRGVDAGGVVGARVQEDYGALGAGGQARLEATMVKESRGTSTSGMLAMSLRAPAKSRPQVAGS